jgi:hypothetical protein
MLTRITAAATFFILGLCSLSMVVGQNFSGRVKDAVTGEPLSGVSVMFKETTVGTATGYDGTFSLTLSDVPAVLVVSHLSYKTLEITINSFPTAKLDITIEPMSHDLGQIDIQANKITEILEGKSYEILDYEFLDKNLLLLANRNGSMFRPCLLLVNLYGDTICSRDISRPEQLYRDFEGNIYFISKLSAWAIGFDGAELHMNYVMEKEEFMNSYPVVVDVRKPDWILKQYGALDQRLDYYRYSEIDSSYNVFCSVVNQDALQRARWGGYFDGTEADAHFAAAIINKPVFAPLFRIGDSLVLFNYLDNCIDFFNQNGEKQKSLNAPFMKQKVCKKQIYKDEITGKFYALFLKNGISSLHEVSLKTGETHFISDIPGFVFVEKIIIRNSEAFFLYKEKTGDEQKRIYRMKL